jgi:hypothetical protein
MRESIAADWAFGITGAIENSVAKLSNTALSSIGFTIEFAKCPLSTGLPAVKTKIWGTITTSVYFAALPLERRLILHDGGWSSVLPGAWPKIECDPSPTRTSNEPTTSWLRMWFAEKPATRHPETSDTT